MKINEVTLSQTGLSTYAANNYGCMNGNSWQVNVSRTGWVEFGLSKSGTTAELDSLSIKITKNTDNTTDSKAVILYSASYPFDASSAVLQCGDGNYYQLLQLSNRNTGEGIHACAYRNVKAPAGAKSARIYRQVYLHNTTHLIVSSTSGASTLGSAQTSIPVDIQLWSNPSCTPPTPKTVSGTTSICSGSNTDVTLASSQSGVTYQLYAGASAFGDPIEGDGDDIVWSVSLQQLQLIL